MKATKRVDTSPELALRSALHRSGLRFRKDHRIVAPGVRVRADVVFRTQLLAIFVDGCFWHRCPIHGKLPARNTSYWSEKLTRNQERDRAVDEGLEAAGWTVLRIWEHEPPEDALAAIVDALRAR